MREQGRLGAQAQVRLMIDALAVPPQEVGAPVQLAVEGGELPHRLTGGCLHVRLEGVLLRQ